MADFLLELRSEEIPARMQAGARAELEKLFRREMEAAGVAPGAITVWSTPRRLALIAHDLPQATEAVREEAKGPPEGAPDQAVDGFCRKNGVTRDQLQLRDVKGRATYFAVIEKPGRAVADLLAEAIPAIIRDFSWPKSMRWGASSISTESMRWVRPLSGIIALLGDDVVACTVGDVVSGRITRGHRFHSQGDISVANAAAYADALRAAYVIVDHEERQNIIRDGAAKAAANAGLVLVEDEGLVVENAGLTEWPVPLLGRFDEAFLDVPPEVIQLTARVNQKYFVCEDNAGKLANAFICTANIAASDGGAAIVDGNRKVLAARLSDARFFWDVDQKTSLADHAKKLERITFHEKLGTVADKVERVAKLARWLVEEGIVQGADPDLTKRAARLCKADLVTEMVGEFPELQGLMGGYYAREERLEPEVADAIRDHYKPVGQGDHVPTAPVTVAVSLADKLDTLISFFAIHERPTGSKDPFALRRAALGIVALLERNMLRFGLSKTGQEHLALLAAQISNRQFSGSAGANFGQMIYDAWRSNRDFGLDANNAPSVINRGGGKTKFSAELAPIAREAINTHNSILGSSEDLIPFLADRLKVQQKEAGVRHDLIDAVFALGGEDDLVRLLARVHALQAFMDTDDGANLLAGYKRAANILKKEGWSTPLESPLPAGEGLGVGAPASQASNTQPQPLPSREGAFPPSYTTEPAEQALIDALGNAGPRAAQAVEAEDFAGAMAALATLRAPIDAFFEDVTVNDENADKRTARLDLLAQFRAAVHNVADFSQIAGG